MLELSEVEKRSGSSVALARTSLTVRAGRSLALVGGALGALRPPLGDLEGIGSTSEAASAGAFCGGIAAIPCPDGYTCVDDPSDGCDPRRGGADCGGICRRSGKTCVETALCIQGYHWDQGRCRCVQDPATQCRPRCGAGEYCTPCRTTTGVRNVCLPDGAVC